MGYETVKNEEPSIQELAAAANMPVRKYRQMLKEAEEVVNSELVRKADVKKTYPKEAARNRQRKLVRDTQTYDSGSMSYRAGVRKVGKGGGTRISAN